MGVATRERQRESNRCSYLSRHDDYVIAGSEFGVGTSKRSDSEMRREMKREKEMEEFVASFEAE